MASTLEGLNVWIYLRKSREDREAEARAKAEGKTEIETLSRHRSALLGLASKHHHQVQQVLEEVVSGEFISERPRMLELLQAVEQETIDGVWVMDLDRLGRGDMADQGMILRTFKDSGTLILTPDKVYDLTDDMDEEWTEFKTFFARRELKMITKRMQRGRIASVREGKFIGSCPPFGYDINSELVLLPNRDAPLVNQIFHLYVYEQMGCTRISQHLNRLKIPSPRGKIWRPESVLNIVRNPVYAGWIVWRKTRVDKRRKTYRIRPVQEQIIAKGRHAPLIDEAVYIESQRIRRDRTHPPVARQHQPTNPFIGIVQCGQCGQMLIRRPYPNQPAHLICKNSHCKQRSTRFSIVEARIIQAIAAHIPWSIALQERWAFSPNVLVKNALIKTLVEKIVYNKEKWQRGDQFELEIYLRLPYTQIPSISK